MPLLLFRWYIRAVYFHYYYYFMMFWRYVYMFILLWAIKDILHARWHDILLHAIYGCHIMLCHTCLFIKIYMPYILLLCHAILLEDILYKDIWMRKMLLRYAKDMYRRAHIYIRYGKSLHIWAQRREPHTYIVDIAAFARVKSARCCRRDICCAFQKRALEDIKRYYYYIWWW